MPVSPSPPGPDDVALAAKHALRLARHELRRARRHLRPPPGLPRLPGQGVALAMAEGAGDLAEGAMRSASDLARGVLEAGRPVRPLPRPVRDLMAWREADFASAAYAALREVASHLGENAPFIREHALAAAFRCAKQAGAERFGAALFVAIVAEEAIPESPDAQISAFALALAIVACDQADEASEILAAAAGIAAGARDEITALAGEESARALLDLWAPHV